MRRIVTVTAAAAIALTASLAAQAGGHRYSDGDAYYVWAKVVDVEPIVHLVQVSTPKQVCWDERVRHVDHGGYRDRSATPVVVGGIIGGVLGNRIVDGRARGVATVAGALLGASVGNDYARAQHRPAPSRSYYTTERRCEIEQVVVVGEEAFAYNPWRGDCAENPLDSQLGTWTYPRAGWCPGAHRARRQFRDRSRLPRRRWHSGRASWSRDAPAC